MKSSVAVLTALALAASAASASAAIINVGDSLSVSGTISGGQDTGWVSGNAGASYEDVYAGTFNLAVQDLTQQGSASFTLLTFCTDVGANWTTPNYYKATTFASVDGVAPPWNNPLPAIQNAAWLYNQEFVGQANLNADETAGVQLAIWKVLSDTAPGGQVSSGFSSGTLRAEYFSSAAMTDAENDISALNAARTGGSFTVYNQTWLQPTDSVGNPILTTQGLLAPAAVPEPTATLAAACLLALPLGASMVRILRKNRLG